MKACVLIEVDDQGQVSVGTYPGDIPAEMKQGMQPAQSVDDALTQAKALLEHGGEEQGETGPENESQEQTPAQGEASFRQGFRKQQPMGGGY